jgi:hypothetical protein
MLSRRYSFLYTITITFSFGFGFRLQFAKSTALETHISKYPVGFVDQVERCIKLRDLVRGY